MVCEHIFEDFALLGPQLTYLPLLKSQCEKTNNLGHVRHGRASDTVEFSIAYNSVVELAFVDWRSSTRDSISFAWSQISACQTSPSRSIIFIVCLRSLSKSWEILTSSSIAAPSIHSHNSSTLSVPLSLLRLLSFGTSRNDLSISQTCQLSLPGALNYQDLAPTSSPLRCIPIGFMYSSLGAC